MILHMLLEGGARLTAKILLQNLTEVPTRIVPVFLPYLEKDMVFERDAGHEKTLLHWAAELGISTLTTRCLELGANIDATDKYGETALHYAAENGHLDIVQILVQANADDTISDSHGRTALDCAQRIGPGGGRRSYPDMVAYLSRTGTIKSG